MSLMGRIVENATINVKLPAWLTLGSIEKNSEITIADVGTPFPLLNVGNQYILFIRVSKDGYSVLYDYVFGPYAYLVKGGKVYSLDHVRYPVITDPYRFFGSDNIRWVPYDYKDLRKIALAKYSVYGIPLENFEKTISDENKNDSG